MSISYDEYKEAELLASAALLGMDEEVLTYAQQSQRQLVSDGDEAFWLDCLEMSYNELIKGM